MSSRCVSPYFLVPPKAPLESFTLFETQSRFFLVGRDKFRRRYRVLKIERNDDDHLSLADDGYDYDENECNSVLSMVKDSNKGGISKLMTARGLLGFVRFLEGYYLLLITKRKKVGEIAGHRIYTIESTAMIPFSVKPSVQVDEARYKALFSAMDLTKGFYFSYSYDVTNTLQSNMGGHPKKYRESPAWVGLSFNEMYAWNEYLLMELLHSPSLVQWVLPVMHGYFSQQKFSIFGRNISLSLIGRRSRYYAGTRYRKRGTNFQGYVANEVEIEQILQDENPSLGGQCPITSFVQLRGSIPLFWTQITDAMVPKPDITLHRFDPAHTATRAHIVQLFRRYAHPIIFVNLIKQYERKKRETILYDEMSAALKTINHRLPQDLQISHIGWDFHAVQKKSPPGSLMAGLSHISSQILSQTGLFFSHNPIMTNDDDDKCQQLGGEVYEVGREQRGVARTNCIDCLDRTNVAQFALGRAALGFQLQLFGVVDSSELSSESPLTQALMATYEDLGDQIALQYVGSIAHAKMEKDKAAHASKMKKIMVTLNRYYKNTFTDAEKQNSIDLFLGNFIPMNGRQQLWELEPQDSDFYLHNAELTPLLAQISNTRDKEWWKRPLGVYFADSSYPPLGPIPPAIRLHIDPRLLWRRHRKDLIDISEAQNLIQLNCCDDKSKTWIPVDEVRDEGEREYSFDATVPSCEEAKPTMMSFDSFFAHSYNQPSHVSVYEEDSSAPSSRFKMIRPRAAWMNLKKFLKYPQQTPKRNEREGWFSQDSFANSFAYPYPASQTSKIAPEFPKYCDLSTLGQVSKECNEAAAQYTCLASSECKLKKYQVPSNEVSFVDNDLHFFADYLNSDILNKRLMVPGLLEPVNSIPIPHGVSTF